MHSVAGDTEAQRPAPALGRACEFTGPRLGAGVGRRAQWRLGVRHWGGRAGGLRARPSSCSSSGRRACGTSSSSWRATCPGTRHCPAPREPRPPSWSRQGAGRGLGGRGLPPPLPPPAPPPRARQGAGRGARAGGGRPRCLRTPAPGGGLGVGQMLEDEPRATWHCTARQTGPCLRTGVLSAPAAERAPPPCPEARLPEPTPSTTGRPGRKPLGCGPRRARAFCADQGHRGCLCQVCRVSGDWYGTRCRFTSPSTSTLPTSRSSASVKPGPHRPAPEPGGGPSAWQSPSHPAAAGAPPQARRPSPTPSSCWKAAGWA